MELRWKNKSTKEFGIAFVTDYDAVVLEAMGYYHCNEEDFTDDEKRWRIGRSMETLHIKE